MNAPNSKLQASGRFKAQNTKAGCGAKPAGLRAIWEFGIPSLIGIWYLVVGAFNLAVFGADAPPPESDDPAAELASFRIADGF